MCLCALPAVVQMYGSRQLLLLFLTCRLRMLSQLLRSQSMKCRSAQLKRTTTELLCPTPHPTQVTMFRSAGLFYRKRVGGPSSGVMVHVGDDVAARWAAALARPRRSAGTAAARWQHGKLPHRLRHSISCSRPPACCCYATANAAWPPLQTAGTVTALSLCPLTAVPPPHPASLQQRV